MMNLAPTIMYLTSLMMLFPSIMFMMTDSMYIIEWNLLFMFSTTVKLNLIMEWKTMVYSFVVMFISASVLKFSKMYMMSDPNKLLFTYLVLLFIVSMNLLIFIPNMMCMLIGWDGLGITSFILIIHYSNSRSMSAGLITITMNRLGDTFLLMAIIFSLTTMDWSLQNTTMVHNNMFQWTGIMVAAMTKSAQTPFSSWLPAAMAAPTPVSALVHSSTLVTAGVFILCRFHNLILASIYMQTALVISGALTTMMAGISAMYETDMKKIIALSTLSQLGMMVLSLGINLPKLAYFHMVCHAMFKALLFIAAGSMISLNNHNQDLRLYGQFSNLSPMVSSSLLISSMALIGVPFMAGHYSKHAIMEWSHNLYINYILYLMMMLSILLTSLYSSRLLLLTSMTPSNTTMHNHLSLINLYSPLILMSIMSTIIGSTLQWMLFVTPISPTNPDDLESMMMNLLIISGVMMSMTSSNNLVKLKLYLYKFHCSLSFLTPISTQSTLSSLMNLSMKLFKHMDQSWLEKMTSHSTETMISNMSKYLSTQPQFNLQQTIMFNSLYTSMTIALMLTMLY